MDQLQSGQSRNNDRTVRNISALLVSTGVAMVLLNVFNRTYCNAFLVTFYLLLLSASYAFYRRKKSFSVWSTFFLVSTGSVVLKGFE